jgi:hypothetical protein
MIAKPSPLKGTEMLVTLEACDGKAHHLGEEEPFRRNPPELLCGKQGILSQWEGDGKETILLLGENYFRENLYLKNQMVPLIPMATYKFSIFLFCGIEID